MQDISRFSEISHADEVPRRLAFVVEKYASNKATMVSDKELLTLLSQDIGVSDCVPVKSNDSK